jgi:PPOX class probable F420-dependent enzyme
VMSPGRQEEEVPSMATEGTVPSRSTTRAAAHGSDRLVVGVTLLAGAGMLVAGVWALLWPTSFAEAVRFPEHTHFVHDLGAFQIGIGLTLVLAALWRDPLAVVLAGFLVANTIHAFNHAVDLDLGGRESDPWLLGALSVLVAVALARRLRQVHHVVGPVRTATDARLAPFVEQKTVRLTTYRRDGTAVHTPLSVAVDGDHGYFRTFEKAGKAKRLRRDSHVELTPSTARGEPTGPPVAATARLLDGAQDRHAARLLRRKHPVLHGIVVPLSHRLGRSKFGATIHYEVAATADPSAHGTTTR